MEPSALPRALGGREQVRCQWDVPVHGGPALLRHLRPDHPGTHGQRWGRERADAWSAGRRTRSPSVSPSRPVGWPSTTTRSSRCTTSSTASRSGTVGPAPIRPDRSGDQRQLRRARGLVRGRCVDDVGVHTQVGRRRLDARFAVRRGVHRGDLGARSWRLRSSTGSQRRSSRGSTPAPSPAPTPVSRFRPSPRWTLAWSTTRQSIPSATGTGRGRRPPLR